MKKWAVVTVFCAALLVGTAAWAGGFEECGSVVMAPSGPVRGIAAETAGVCAWLGLPYAEAPVGERRWRRPEPMPAWTGTFEAAAFGSECAQKTSMLAAGSGEKVGEARGSEDCLFLNIWRPAKSGEFPVMVWIHGGTLLTGSGSGAIYRGDRLAMNQDVVVVTINYRLGPLGFLALPEARAEDAGGAVGGYGHLDQVQALKWVKSNIGAFGGDSSNVTIFGESAGGWSVCTLMASPLAAGLFEHAIQQSGGCRRYKTLEDGYAYGRDLAVLLGCDPDRALECLRQKSADDLLANVVWDETGDESPFMPHVDGYLLTKSPLDHLIDGDYNRVPFMAGSNRDETRPLILMQRDKWFLSPKKYRKVVEQEYGSFAPELLEVYPLEAFKNPTNAYIQLTSDRILGCGGHDAVQAVARWQEEVYYYRFDFDEFRGGKRLGAFHAVEIPFVFSSLDVKPFTMFMTRRYLPNALALSKIMQSCWAIFARTGATRGGDPTWPAYDDEKRSRLIFDREISVVREPDEQYRRCEVWDRYHRANHDTNQ